MIVKCEKCGRDIYKIGDGNNFFYQGFCGICARKGDKYNKNGVNIEFAKQLKKDTERFDVKI